MKNAFTIIVATIAALITIVVACISHQSGPSYGSAFAIWFVGVSVYAILLRSAPHLRHRRFFTVLGGIGLLVTSVAAIITLSGMYLADGAAAKFGIQLAREISQFNPVVNEIESAYEFKGILVTAAVGLLWLFSASGFGAICSGLVAKP